MGFLSSKDGEEAFAVERIGRSAASCFDEGGEQVEVFDHGWVDGARFDLTGPTGDEACLKAVVIAGPLGKGEGAALFGGDNEESVVGEAILFDKVHGLADLGIEIGNLGEVAAHAVPGFGGIDEVGRELDFIAGVTRGIALVPRGVWFVGAKKEAEGLLFGGLLFNEGAHFVELGIFSAGDFFPAKDIPGRDVCFTALSDGVTKVGEVLNDAFSFWLDEGVVGVGSTDNGWKSGVDVVSGRGAHWGGLKAACEAHALGGELVDVGGVGLPAITAEVAEGAIVSDDEDDIGFGRACTPCVVRSCGEGDEEEEKGFHIN